MSNDKQTAEWWADWLLDAIATATQDRRFLRGDQLYDEDLGATILANGEKAIRNALAERTKRGGK